MQEELQDSSSQHHEQLNEAYRSCLARCRCMLGRRRTPLSSEKAASADVATLLRRASNLGIVVIPSEYLSDATDLTCIDVPSKSMLVTCVPSDGQTRPETVVVVYESLGSSDPTSSQHLELENAQYVFQQPDFRTFRALLFTRLFRW